jgi:hypothetical protein
MLGIADQSNVYPSCASRAGVSLAESIAGDAPSHAQLLVPNHPSEGIAPDPFSFLNSSIPSRPVTTSIW